MTTPVLRFAPSPNGELHLGHAYSALLNHDLARAWGGRLLLRIEDIDTTRCAPRFETGIYCDLEWLGVKWERPPRRQSEHLNEYREALHRLMADDLVYPAFMSRGEIRAHIVEHEATGQKWPRDPDGAPLYPALDKTLSDRQRYERLASSKPFAWRLNMERALERAGIPPAPGIGHHQRFPTWRELKNVRLDWSQISARTEHWGDVVIARSDIPTSYHLSVVLDDALQGATHVVRGEDLFSATAIHRLLQILLDLPDPIYHHHRLILGPNGRKLSKSERSTGLGKLRESGVTPDHIRDMVGL